MQPMQPMPPMQPMQPMMGGSYPRVINSYPHPHMHQPVSVSNAPTPQVSQVRVLNTSSSQPLSQLKRSSHQIYQGSAVYMSPTMVIQPSSPIRSQYMGSPVNQQKIWYDWLCLIILMMWMIVVNCRSLYFEDLYDPPAVPAGYCFTFVDLLSLQIQVQYLALRLQLLRPVHKRLHYVLHNLLMLCLHSHLLILPGLADAGFVFSQLDILQHLSHKGSSLHFGWLVIGVLI